MKFILMIMFIFGVLIAPVLGSGPIETVVTFDIDGNELTEGVAIDADGNIYVSLSPLGEIVMLAPDLECTQLPCQ